MTEEGGGDPLRVTLLLVAKEFSILPFGSLPGPWTALGSASPIFGFCLDWRTQRPEDGSAQPRTEADEPQRLPGSLLPFRGRGCSFHSPAPEGNSSFIH